MKIQHYYNMTVHHHYIGVASNIRKYQVIASQIIRLNLLIFLISNILIISCNSNGNTPDTKTQNELRKRNDAFHVSLEYALNRASDKGKHIVLNIYTEWCGLCTIMEDDTYADEKVQKTLEKYFYVVRIDAESELEIIFLGKTYTMRELALQFGVNSFPTTVFLSPYAEPIGVLPGFIEANQFYNILSFVGSKSYKTQTLQHFMESASD